MGKKAKNKGKTSRKLPVPSSPRSNSHPKSTDPSVEAKGACEHYEKESSSANRVLLKLRPASSVAVCEDCRDECRVKIDGKGKGKSGRKKAGPAQSKSSNLATIWVCLDCGHFGCAGDADISKPYGHARRHHKQNKHVLAVRLDDPQACWCFTCDSHMSIELPAAVSADYKPTNRVDSGESVDQGVERGATRERLIVEVGKEYTVRGIVNLGNTCFFNSIMQNLFAMDMMREYFLSLSIVSGPLTMALKKLFVETGTGVEPGKGTVNPKNFFGCICSKAPQFRGYQQQDSHELLRYLLDGLSTEEVNSRKLLSLSEDMTTSQPPSTFVDDLFGGQISSTVCCVECGHTSVVYEPFLDLSLPVPAKKAPPKKVTSTQPKKARLPPSSRGRKARDRVIMKHPSLDHLKAEVEASLDSREQNVMELPEVISKSNTSFNSLTKHAENSSFAEGDETWMDFIGPATQSSDDLALQDAEDMGVIQRKGNDLKATEEPLLPEEPSGEEADIPSKILHSEIQLIPYKDVTSTSQQISEMIGDSWIPENAGSNCSAVNATDVAPTSSSGCGSAEVEFEGLGDLFAEPEATSTVNSEVTVGEDPEMSWLSGTSSECTQEEVDNTEAQVSVDSCLAYFTKSELLSGEHAWHCENCSKNLLQLNQENHSRTITNDGLVPSTMKVGNNSNSGDNMLNALSLDSSHQALENVKSAHFLECESGGSESRKDTSDTEVYISKTSFDRQCMNGYCSALANLDVCPEIFSEIPSEENGIADSATSKYFSCTSSVDKVNCIVGSGDLNIGSCSNNNLNDDGRGVQLLVESSKVLRDCMEENFSNGCGSDGSNSSRKGRKKGGKLLSRMHNNEEIEPENVKVKRDATKRILVYKTPSILTIHLKRFSQDTRGRLNKLSGHVHFKELLDLSSYMDTSCRESVNYWYRLVGLVEHSGNMRGGHYIAYVRGQQGKGKVDDDGPSKAWFYTSDDHVREASLSEVLQSEAYILFYERVQP